jgi:hypothetical protein
MKYENRAGRHMPIRPVFILSVASLAGRMRMGYDEHKRESKWRRRIALEHRFALLPFMAALSVRNSDFFMEAKWISLSQSG